MERKLAAIFAADMVGYARLVEADEVGTLERQKIHRTELIDLALEAGNGRIVKEMGDGILAEFPSVVEAVQCAVTIQRAMVEREAGVAKDMRIQYRIGINLGDIVVEGDDIYGDGVNVAARLEQLAEPGGICISGTAYDHMRSTVEVGYESLGETRVKNIERPIRAYRVLMDSERAGKVIPPFSSSKTKSRNWVATIATVLLIAVVGGGTWWWSQRPDFQPTQPDNFAFKLPDKPSIAVLPFINLTTDGSKQHLANGLSENIISALSRISEMFVIASGSTATYNSAAVEARQVAEELGVRHVLNGTVQQVNDRVRVTAQLIDAVKGHYRWSGRYDRNLTDLLAVQDEITRQIVVALRVELTEGVQAAIQFRQSTSNISAWELSVQARVHIRQISKQDNAIAERLLKSSLELDPTYSHGWGLLAWVHWQRARYGFGDKSSSLILATDAANKALELNDRNSDAIAALGVIHLVERDYTNAISALRNAIAINPNNADGLAVLAGVLTFAGKPDEAIGLLQQAMRLAPSYPAWNLIVLGRAYRMTKQFDEAITAATKGVRRNPNSLFFQVERTAILSEAGKKDEARTAAKEVLRLNPEFSANRWAAAAAAFADPVDQRRFVDALIEAGLPK